jgi:hypothetical protein
MNSNFCLQTRVWTEVILPASQDAGNRFGHDTILLDAFVEFMKFKNLCDSDFGILIWDPDLEP